MLSWGVLDRASDLISTHKLSFWEAMIVAACLEVGVMQLYTEDEDFGGQPYIGGLEILNPFEENSE
jgi:predicted nucleic acid-binding protein